MSVYSYTDFLVNEILLDGKVVHLQNTKPAKAELPPQRQMPSLGDAEKVHPLPSEQTGVNGNLTSAYSQELGDAAGSSRVSQELPSTTTVRGGEITADAASNEVMPIEEDKSH